MSYPIGPKTPLKPGAYTYKSPIDGKKRPVVIELEGEKFLRVRFYRDRDTTCLVCLAPGDFAERNDGEPLPNAPADSAE